MSRMFHLIALFAALLACAGSLRAVEEQSADSTFVIGGILTQVGDVIPPWSEEAHDSNRILQFGYRLTNALHIATRKHVVERELLFKVGDTLDTLSLQETARNLRAYPFINEAEVTPYTDESGATIVHVRTSDNFSIAPGIIFEGGGGGTTYGAILTETNLFGLGKRVAGQYIRETGTVNTTTWAFEYKDHRVFGSRWFFHLYAEDLATGSQIATVMEYPFYRLSSQNASGWSLDFNDSYRRMYGTTSSRVGDIVAEIPRRYIGGNAWYSYRWGDDYRRTKLTSAIAWYDYSYSGLPRTIVDTHYTITQADTTRTPRRGYQLTASIGREAFTGFLTSRFLDDFLVVEDVDTGWEFGATGGVGIPEKPTRELYGITGVYGSYANVFGASGDHIVAAEATGVVHLADDHGLGRRTWSNLVTDAWVHWYWQGLPIQTIATSLNWYAGWRMYDPFQITLGGDTGLRGYATNQFAGNRRLLLNVEDRIFPGWRIFTVAIGLVGFADAGYVWKADERLNPADLHANVGFGLRVGNTRASTSRISRLDFAFALRGEKRIMLAFGSEQVFDLFNIRPTPTRD